VRRLGVHALVWVGGWSRAECEQAARATAEAGYDLLEIPALSPETIDVEHTRATLAAHGLGAVCSLGLTPERDVASEDPERVAAGRARLAEALAVARGVDAEMLAGVVYGALGRYASPPTAAARANAVAAVQELCAAAAPDGITVALEVVNRYETNLLNTAAQALAFCDEVGAGNVGVHLDTYHMNIEEHDPGEAIEACGRRLAYFHLGESHRGQLGTGSVDFAAIFAALERVGYAGDVTFESFSSAVVSPDLSSTLCIWRELWDDGAALARGAREYVEAQRRALATS